MGFGQNESEVGKMHAPLCYSGLEKLRNATCKPSSYRYGRQLQDAFSGSLIKVEYNREILMHEFP